MNGLKTAVDIIFYTILGSVVLIGAIRGIIWIGCNCDKYIWCRIIVGLLVGAVGFVMGSVIILKIMFTLGLLRGV